MLQLFKRHRHFAADRRAMRIAARYGLVAEYKEARRHGCTPQEALEDWDLMSTTDLGD